MNASSTRCDVPAVAAPPALRRRKLWITAVMVAALSSLIAFLLVLTEDHYADLPYELLISNAIGMSIWALIEGLHTVSQGRIGLVTAAVIGVPAGIIIGGKFAALFGAYDVVGSWTHDPLAEWKSISITLLFAASASAFVILFWRASNFRVELESERRRSAEAGRAQAVAELALLQAQIEPHFLFNTLAHVQSAIEQEPALGKAMLEHLIRYLRGTLRRTRQSRYSLGEELELVESLLAIAAMRLGGRLQYHTDVAEELRRLPVPPLLLQPLVENAIRHGIEPAVTGGRIAISAAVDAGVLVLRVADTGAGIAQAAPEGMGLSNVRSRLTSLYGGGGRLNLLRVEPHGTVAELSLPLPSG